MIKTNIKMRVTPEQSVKVQEICFNRGFEWVSGEKKAIYINEPFITISSEKDIRWIGKDRESIFIEAKEKEIDPELFIRTNGSCVEDNNKAKNPNSKHYELWENFEAIDVIKLALTDEEYKGFLKGNILKYRLRAGKKNIENDNIIKDINKSIDYERELNK